MLVAGSHRSFALSVLLQLAAGAVIAQDLSHVHSYGGPASEVPSGAVPTSDGGVLVVGATGSFGQAAYDGNPNAHVLRVDAFGQRLWNLSFGGWSFDDLMDAALLPDGDVLAIGSTGTLGMPGTRQLLLSRIRVDGTVLWHKNVGAVTHHEYGYQIRVLANGDGLLVGTSYLIGGPGDRQVLAIRVNGDGEVIWATELYTGADEAPTDVLTTPDGGALITGIRITEPVREAFLIKLAADGTLLWDRSYRTEFVSVGFSAIAPLGSDGYMVATSTYLLGMDLSGNILWQRGYSSGQALIFQQIVPIGPNSFLVLGSTVPQPPEPGAILALLVDQTGNPLDARQYTAGPANSMASTAMVHPDGAITIVGQVAEQGGDIGILRLPSPAQGLAEGCFSANINLTIVGVPAFTHAPAFTQVSLPGVLASPQTWNVNTSGNSTTHCTNVGLSPTAHRPVLQLHPVPTQHVLHLGGPFPYGPLEVEIWNPAGQCMLRINAVHARQLDVGSLAPGPYLCRVRSSGAPWAVSRFQVVR